MKKHIKGIFVSMVLSVCLSWLLMLPTHASSIKPGTNVTVSGTGSLFFTPDTSGLYKVCIKGLDTYTVEAVLSETEDRAILAAYFIPDEGWTRRAYELEAGQTYKLSYYEAPSDSSMEVVYLTEEPNQPWLRKGEKITIPAGAYGVFRIPAGYSGDDLSVMLGKGVEADKVELWTAGITNNYIHMDKVPAEVRTFASDTYLHFEGIETPITVCVNQIPDRDVTFALMEGMDYAVRNISGMAVIEDIPDQKYTGKALKPAVRLTCEGVLLQEGVDYDVSYRNNTKIGTAGVTISGKGRYTGIVESTFDIVVSEGSSYTVGKQRYTITDAHTNGSGTVRLDYATDKTITAVKITPSLNLGGKQFKITEIRASAFKGCEQLKGVTIGNNVDSIGDNAFYGCSALEYVIGAAYVKTIGDRAFYNCTSLIKYGNSNNRITAARTIEIGADAFRNCTSAKYVNLSSKELTTIGARAFFGCSSVDTLIVSSPKLERIGGNAFGGITGTCIFK